MNLIKEFSDKEREHIRALLMERGKQLFASHGVRKTSVGDLAKAAGIAKGSFYSFFISKEELYFQILKSEIAEASGSQTFAGVGPASRKQAIAAMLTLALQSVQTNPVFRLMLNRDEYEAVYRKLAANGDYGAELADPIAALLGGMQRGGVIAECDVAVYSGIVKSLFLLTTHRWEIGEPIFDAVLGELVDMVAERIASIEPNIRSSGGSI